MSEMREPTAAEKLRFDEVLAMVQGDNYNRLAAKRLGHYLADPTVPVLLLRQASRLVESTLMQAAQQGPESLAEARQLLVPE